MIERFLVHPVTIVAPASTTNRYGDSVPDWDGATRTDATGWFASTSTTETIGDERAGLTTLAELSLPADAPITDADRVEIDGQSWEIIGTIRRSYTPADTVHHLVVDLRKVDG